MVRMGSGVQIPETAPDYYLVALNDASLASTKCQGIGLSPETAPDFVIDKNHSTLVRNPTVTLSLKECNKVVLGEP